MAAIGCEALQLWNAYLNMQSTASCHHSSPEERAQHRTWQEAPQQLKVLLGPPHMDSRTPNHASGPPSLAEHQIHTWPVPVAGGEVW